MFEHPWRHPFLLLWNPGNLYWSGLVQPSSQFFLNFWTCTKKKPISDGRGVSDGACQKGFQFVLSQVAWAGRTNWYREHLQYVYVYFQHSFLRTALWFQPSFGCHYQSRSTSWIFKSIPCVLWLQAGNLALFSIEIRPIFIAHRWDRMTHISVNRSEFYAPEEPPSIKLQWLLP
jgi:hypothetical protein